MTVLRFILLIAHFIGLAALLGPFLEQWRSSVKRITTTMVWGARIQVVTGLALVGLAMAGDADFDHVKIAVKFVVAIAIAGVAEVAHKRASTNPRFWELVGVLTLVNVVIAVVWR